MKGGENCVHTVTVNYRAPDVFLGSQTYAEDVGLLSLRCAAVELPLGDLLFRFIGGTSARAFFGERHVWERRGRGARKKGKRTPPPSPERSLSELKPTLSETHTPDRRISTIAKSW